MFKGVIVDPIGININYKKLEGYGLILILFSFGWQMLETDLSNLFTDC